VDIGNQLFLNMNHDVLVPETRGEIGQVKEDDGVLVEVLLERRVGGYFKVGEKMSRVARMVIIGAQHLGRHRFAKTAAARHATETALGEKRPVDDGDKPRLVNIFTFSYPLKSSITNVYIYAHDI